MSFLRRVGLAGMDPLADGLMSGDGRTLLSVGFVAALLGFLAVLALALALATGRLAASWQGELADTATLQIIAAEPQIEEQARAALEVMRTTPGVLSVRMVDLDEQERLLAPWLGPDVPIENLPVPLMVEVETDRAMLDQPALVARLRAEAPAAVYDDHAVWRQPLIATAERVRLFALACLGLLGLTLAAVAGLAARAAVAVNGGTVAMLRLVGARDRFIRGALVQGPVRASVAGAGVGTVVAMGFLAFVPAGSEPGFFLAGIGLSGWHWLLPLLVPPAAGLVAWAGAALAARRGLRAWS